VTRRVAAIWRHPIKAHGRERLPEVALEAGRTLPGDRAWAVLHEAGHARRGEWAACRNFTRGAGTPSLMAIEARTLEDGRIALTHPEWPLLDFDPVTEAAVFLDWVRPLMADGRAAPVGIVPAPERQGMTDVPDPWISLFGLASHRDVASRLGRDDLSTERWRANIVLAGVAPWEEFDWVGREVRIGDATIAVRERVGRCLATAANPATGNRDADTLGTLEAIHGERHFAVYAEVTRGGRVAEGDRVEPL
jgi:uncharacterized protein